MNILGKKKTQKKKKLPLSIEKKDRHILVLTGQITHQIMLQ